MLGITRTDIINDDLGALTDVPRKLGRGAGLKLNDIFWTAFLDNAAFFAAGNFNVSTDTGELGLVGLEEAETVFMNQTDPDGNPLGIEPAILLVPTALKTTARQLMTSDKIKGSTDEPEVNPWQGRFRTESSPYMSNANYTGNSESAWYLLADPRDMPVIEIAALDGKIEPTVETAEADFDTLGVQMRGYSDVGVNKQEPRGGVRADGSAAD
ncbi:Mu-like prophage major head subunit gpT family protein [Stieleria sp. TO1_6]|uniref:phage major capsid protein n=1 Tax=Stieleria tagensis TaxID=2956795 RepID=UPI00209A6CD7|nr:Mu-like prophage major head subunit gpT family protein [Stieleria tagensis]MCO8123413.1 Mu-like prophage major head subunit gpT family protein [Stieleria tagensis]